MYLMADGFCWTQHLHQINGNPPVGANTAGAPPGSLHQIRKDASALIAEEMTEKK